MKVAEILRNRLTAIKPVALSLPNVSEPIVSIIWSISQQKGKVPLPPKDVEDTIKTILPIVDAAERILSAWGTEASEDPSISAWIDALRGFYRRLTRTLERWGLEEVPLKGKIVDLSAAEVVGVKPELNLEKGIVLEVLQKAYRWQGKIIQEGKVIVASGEG